MAAAMSERSSWPLGPTRGSHTDDDAQDQALPDQGPAQAVIVEMTRLLRDTRGNMLMAGGMRGASTTGIALEAALSARVLRLGFAGVLNVGLLLCWLRAVTLLALGKPVLNALRELRWGTGAPLDLRTGRLTLPWVGTNPGDWTWIRVHLLLGAARLARYRMQLADTWTYATAVCFLAWTAVIVLGL